MSPVSIWLAIILIGLITFAYRLSFIWLMERINLPRWLREALRFVPVAALTAIITPELLTRNGQIITSLNNARLWAGLIAAAVAWRTRNVFITIAAGMLALWALQLILL